VIYLDHNATTPVDPQVAEAFLPHVTEHFGNPSSNHAYGRIANDAATRARAAVAGLIDATPGEIAFTGSGSEANTLAIRELAALAHTRGALFHTDASQTLAKVPVSVREFGVDLLTVTGHKMYAPTGVGALYVHTGLPLEPTIYGGGQENGHPHRAPAQHPQPPSTAPPATNSSTPPPNRRLHRIGLPRRRYPPSPVLSAMGLPAERAAPQYASPWNGGPPPTRSPMPRPRSPTRLTGSRTSVRDS
jgi:hypothetical protein